MNRAVTTQADSHRLDREQIAQFHREGFLGPFTLCSPQEMAGHRERIDRNVLPVDPPMGPNRNLSRHLDSRVIYDLCAHPAIVQRIASLMGEDLLLWRSALFCKEPGGLEIPWHQDLNYWPIEPPVNISAWLAIDEVSVDNSCVQLIPRSHRTLVPHIAATEEQRFAEQADPAHFNAAEAINMTLQPGQFFLFTERLLHHSEPNRSKRRRLGLAVRVTVPFVRVEHAAGYECILIHGRDRMGFNALTKPPAAP